MKTTVLSGFISLVLGPLSSAWIRSTVTDEQAVTYAQVIVIAHLKENSLVVSPKSQHCSGGTSASAVLIVSKVLKGSFIIEEIPIEIAYGLRAAIGGEIRYLNTKTGEGYPDENVKTGEIRIYDSSEISDEPFTGDLNQDQIWLLRANMDGSGSAIKKLRVWDPEDIQPASKKATLLKLIADSDAERKKTKQDRTSHWWQRRTSSLIRFTLTENTQASNRLVFGDYVSGLGFPDPENSFVLWYIRTYSIKRFVSRRGGIVADSHLICGEHSGLSDFLP